MDSTFWRTSSMMKSAAGQWGSQRHVDGGFSLVGDVYFVNQSQIVYVYRNFGIEYGFEHIYYLFFYFKLSHICISLKIHKTKLKKFFER